MYRGDEHRKRRARRGTVVRRGFRPRDPGGEQMRPPRGRAAVRCAHEEDDRTCAAGARHSQ